MSHPLTPEPLVPELPAPDLPPLTPIRLRSAAQPDHLSPAAAVDPIVPELLNPPVSRPDHLSEAAIAAAHDALSANTLKS